MPPKRHSFAAGTTTTTKASASPAAAAFAAHYIPRAIQWIETCLLAAPDHPMLHGMLITAKRMQAENNNNATNNTNADDHIKRM
jgi:hypothetical protein